MADTLFDLSTAGLPGLEVLVQVADDSGNPLLPGTVDYESAVTMRAAVASRS
jgi:hypothetical protein